MAKSKPSYLPKYPFSSTIFENWRRFNLVLNILGLFGYSVILVSSTARAPKEYMNANKGFIHICTLLIRTNTVHESYPHSYWLVAIFVVVWRDRAVTDRLDRGYLLVWQDANSLASFFCRK
jgi:hypothetical protein